MSKDFKFKQFSIAQDKCAMKIGTDGILLGAWANLNHNPFSILDIGTGTGVIALMLAQRSEAELIDAIEIDEDAYEQAVENFENSPWGDRLFCYHADLDEFTEEMIDEEYDLIISNPPFYEAPLPSESLSNEDISNSRRLARFNDALPFDALIESTAKLLSRNGQFAVIIPFLEETNFITIAKNHLLYPNKITRVKGTKDTAIKRSLLQFSFKEISVETIEIDELIIEISRHEYTQDYINLVRDFYIKM